MQGGLGGFYLFGGTETARREPRPPGVAPLVALAGRGNGEAGRVLVEHGFCSFYSARYYAS